jgi:DNA repair exonuclease SbcCD ATPase subunit
MGQPIAWYREKVTKEIGKRDGLISLCDQSDKNIKSLEQDRNFLEEAQVFLQSIAQETQNQLRIHIKEIVQLCLDTIWEGEIKFDVLFEISRNKTECRLIFIIDGEEVDPMNADGGGLVQIAAFALRIAVWTLGTTRNTIVLDEPLNALSDNLQPLAAEILKELSNKLELQFIIVTHRKELTGIADKIFVVNRTREGNFCESRVTENQ